MSSVKIYHISLHTLAYVIEILPWTLHSFDHGILLVDSVWTRGAFYTCFGTV